MNLEDYFGMLQKMAERDKQLRKEQYERRNPDPPHKVDEERDR
jgi:hypothetical protein